eukprot:UN17250
MASNLNYCLPGSDWTVFMHVYIGENNADKFILSFSI